MKRLIVGVILSVAAIAASAQVCDVTYTAEVETMDGQNVLDSSLTQYAVPMDQVLFNHVRQVKVLDTASKEQDKGGPYKADVGEFRTCDGGAKVKVVDGSVSLQGVTYAGSTRIADEALKQAKDINDFHKGRVKKGEKTSWDHKKAKKVKRDDLGNKVKEDKK